MIQFGNSSNKIFITLGVFSFASLKLVPTITNLMRGIQALRYNSVVVDLIYDELINNNEDYDLVYKDKSIKNKKSFDFRKIKFSKVSYSYPSSTPKVFDEIDIEINNGDKVGFIGESGSGKTTLINLDTK